MIDKFRFENGYIRLGDRTVADGWYAGNAKTAMVEGIVRAANEFEGLLTAHREIVQAVEDCRGGARLPLVQQLLDISKQAILAAEKPQ